MISSFLRRRMLGLSSGIEELGSVRWELALCLLACWLFCYFSIWKSVRSSGKVLQKHIANGTRTVTDVFFFVKQFLCHLR